MYFHNEKSNTNIDKEFKNSNNNLSSFKEIFNKYKIFIIVGITLFFLLMMIIFFVNKKPSINLELNGEEIITIYQGSDYVEPGYNAYNSKKEDLSKEVIIKSNLNINVIGKYEITYTLGERIQTRTVNVIEKTQELTYIYLTPFNNNINIYLKKGEEYKEPGYQVINSEGKDLNSRLTITGSVDTSKRGTYKLIYSVTDDNGVIISAERTVTVLDADINLSLDNTAYTNKQVTINAIVMDDYFDYLVLPNKDTVTKNKYSYIVTENGTYTFIAYNSKGMSKEASIKVSNIDKKAPSGSCQIDENYNGSIIKINATDQAGIQKYIYNNKTYTTNTINLSTFIKTATVTVYDNANNTTNITCTVVPKAYINNIGKDGVIITINAKKVSSEIAGYYFSYNNQRPNKETGGYIATNKESIEIVRLPGTTYVWVEDKNGKISEPKTVTITNDALLITNGSNYKILEGTQLSTYLSNNGWSIEELNKLIARSARAAGLYTKEASATSAVAFQTVIAQKYKIKLPYWWGGKSWSYGASSSWGKYKVTSNGNQTNYYYGLDCSGFTAWAYVNAGYSITHNGKYPYPRFWDWKRLTFNKENGEIGDFLVNSGHVKLIIGKTPDAFITAEAKGKAYGMVVNTHSYSNPNGYKVVKADTLMSTYDRVDQSTYPTGF